MRVDTVNAAGSELLDPDSGLWRGKGEAVNLAPVPLQAQATRYIRNTWREREYGRTSQASLAAQRKGETLFLRLEWPDDARPNGEFGDAAGVLFPIDGKGVPATLGDFEAPLVLWYWQDGRLEPLTYKTHGPGVFAREETNNIEAAARLSGHRWSLVLSGPIGTATDGKIAVAIWNGSNEERAGLAAVTAQWLPLDLD